MNVNIFKVVVHFAAEYGQIEYDAHEKKFSVALDNPDKKQSVETYLANPHVIDYADGQDVHTFHSKNVTPTENIESMKLALTRLWQHTGVYVDWSRPTA